MFLNRFYYFYVKQSREYHNLIMLYSHYYNYLVGLEITNMTLSSFFCLTLHWFLFHFYRFNKIILILIYTVYIRLKVLFF